MYFKNGNLKLGKIEDLTIEKIESITDEQWEQLKEEDQIAIHAQHELLTSGKQEEVEDTSAIAKKDNGSFEQMKGSSQIKKYDAKAAIENFNAVEIHQMEHDANLNKIHKISRIVEGILFGLALLVSIITDGVKSSIGYPEPALLTIIPTLLWIGWIVAIVLFVKKKRSIMDELFETGFYDSFAEDAIENVYPTLIGLRRGFFRKRKFINEVYKRFDFISKEELAYVNSKILKILVKEAQTGAKASGLRQSWVDILLDKKSLKKLKLYIYWPITACIVFYSVMACLAVLWVFLVVVNFFIIMSEDKEQK